MLSMAAGYFLPGLLLSQNQGLTAILWVTALQEILLLGIPGLLIALKSKETFARVKALVTVPDPLAAGLSMLGAVAFTMAGLLITLVAYAVLESAGVPPDAPPSLDPASIPELVLSILCAAIIPALCEELLFRGVLWGMLGRKTGPRWAAGITAFLFAALHFTLLGFPVLLALGVLLAKLMEKRRSLALCVIFHAMYNLSILVINYSGATPNLFAILASTAVAWVTLRILLKEEKHELPSAGV